MKNKKKDNDNFDKVLKTIESERTIIPDESSNPTDMQQSIPSETLTQSTYARNLQLKSTDNHILVNINILLSQIFHCFHYVFYEGMVYLPSRKYMSKVEIKLIFV